MNLAGVHEAFGTCVPEADEAFSYYRANPLLDPPDCLFSGYTLPINFFPINEQRQHEDPIQERPLDHVRGVSRPVSTL